MSDISNTDDIQYRLKPGKKICSVQATSTTTHLTPLITALPLATVELTKITELPQFVNNIYVSRLTKNLLMLLNVSNQGLKKGH